MKREEELTKTVPDIWTACVVFVQLGDASPERGGPVSRSADVSSLTFSQTSASCENGADLSPYFTAGMCVSERLRDVTIAVQGVVFGPGASAYSGGGQRAFGPLAVDRGWEGSDTERDIGRREGAACGFPSLYRLI